MCTDYHICQGLDPNLVCYLHLILLLCKMKTYKVLDVVIFFHSNYIYLFMMLNYLAVLSHSMKQSDYVLLRDTNT